LVEDPKSHQVLHFAEKPETFVSDLASCGVYIFSPSVFTALEDIAVKFCAKEVDILGQSPVRPIV
jgi:mannose-1-phosphate guanylyltransferase